VLIPGANVPFLSTPSLLISPITTPSSWILQDEDVNKSLSKDDLLPIDGLSKVEEKTR